MKQSIDSFGAGTAGSQAGRQFHLARRTLAAAIAAAFASTCCTVPATAWAQLPTGGAVVHGSAAIATDGGRMTVTNSPNAVLNWQAFSIGAQNSVHFAQQGAASQVLNRVVGNDPSAILGSLSSNGGVWLINPHGVLFGANARIDVGGLVASTLPVSNEDFLAGRLRFDGGARPGGQVLNQGEIRTSFGGRVWLLGDAVRNEGLVQSPGGQIVLAAGKSIELVDSGMPNLTVKVTAPDNAAVNLGTLLAASGGSIDVHGGIVNQQGILRADSIGPDAAGRVVIKARGDVQLGAASITSAAAAGSGTGGSVLVASSDGATRVQGQVATTSAGGKGGRIHLLGKQVGVHGHAQVDASGATGADEVLVGGDYQGANPAVRNADVSYLGPAASLRASATGSGDGGKVIVWGNQTTRVFGAIEARGGPGGGDGGMVETSGHFLDARPRRIDVGAAHGKSGTWLLDPGNITIIDGCCSPGGVDYDDSADLTATSVADDAVILNTTITDALERGTNVIVRTGGGANTTQAGDIVVAADIVAHDPADSVSLRLEAHNDIVVNSGVTIASDDTPSTISLRADSDGDSNGDILLQTGSRISARLGGIGLYGGPQQFGPAERIQVRGATLDAGAGSVGLYGRTVEVTGGSTLVGQNVAILADALRVSDSTVSADSDFGTGYIYLFGTTGRQADTIRLENARFTASGPESVSSIIQARQLDLVNTRFTTADALEVTATEANITRGSALRARDIGITAGNLAVLDSQLSADAGRLNIEVSQVHGGSGAATLRNADLAANSGTGSGAGVLSIVADNLEAMGTNLRGAARVDLLAPIVTVGGNSDIAGGSVAIRGDHLDVADTRVTGVADGVAFEARTAAADGSAVLRNVTVAAEAEAGPGQGTIGIVADAVELADADLTGSGVIAIEGTSTAIDNRGSVADIRATGLSIIAGTTRLDGVNVVASGADTPILITTDSLTSRTSRLSTPAGRWLVYLNRGQSGFPAADLGDLPYTFVQVDAVDTAPARFGVGAHGILMADPLDVQIKVNAARPYDGTLSARFTQALSHNAGTGFTVRPAEGNDVAVASFIDKNAGQNKPIGYESDSDYFVIGAPNGSRVYGASQSYVGDITPKAITVSGLVAASKVYDASRAATVSGSLAGIVEGDRVTLDGATGLFDTKNVGTGKTVTLSGGTLAGADAANYQVGGNPTTTADITARPISAAGITAADKVYDGTRVAALTGVLTDALAGDDVRVGGSGQFDTKDVGTGKVVTVTGSALAGTDAGNYILAGGAATTAAITPRSIAANGLRALDKVYDGTRAATVAGSLEDVIPGDILFLAGVSGLFADKNAGNGKRVTIVGGTLGGLDAGNYILAALPTLQADITPRPISAAGITAASKVYDGTRTATISGTLAEALAGDDVTLAGATGLFDTKNAGTGKTVALSGGTLAGVDAGNYRLGGDASTTADITPRPIAATGIGAADKVYDGTRVATLTGVLTDALAGDDVALNGATGLFDTKSAGVDKIVAISPGSLTGADAGNYVLAESFTTRAAITPRPVQIGLTGQVVKEYDASAAATLGPNQFVLAGVIEGDAVGVNGPAQGNYDSANVGQGKNVRVTGVFQISGADAANYRVGGADPATGPVTATASGNIGAITPATLVYTATPLVREAGQPLDGLSGSVTGFKGADSLASATSGVLVWQSPAATPAQPGSYPVLGAGLAALNYVLVQAPGNAVALEITPGNSPANPPRQAQESSVAAIASALNAALPAIDPRRANSGLLDISNPAVGRTYGAVRIGAMSQGELAQLIAQRRNFKRKLFADAIHKLELDPRLADVQPCSTIVESSAGACRLTPNQLDLIQGDTRLAALAGKLETTGSSAGGSSGGSAAASATKGAARSGTAHVPQIQRKIAVLFGINDYADKTIPPLENAVPDVDAVSTLFAEKLGYEVRVVRNPTKADIIRTLNQLSVEIGSNDSVVIYYAGHGYSLEKNGAGYWLPADALSSDPAHWISNSDVSRLLSGIRSSQMVLISDSCYSGAFAREGMETVGLDVTPEAVLAKRSVVVISSGGDEPVADEGKDGHSIFAWNLMQAMGTVSSWKPGSTVFNDVQAGVRKEFPQTPKYGAVTAAGHQAGGDYLFELR